MAVAVLSVTTVVALYGIDFLMKDKLNQFNSLQADLENGVDLKK